MEMEDHHQHQLLQHGLTTDLRQLQLIMHSPTPTSMQPPPQLTAEQLFSGHQNLPPPLVTTTTTITNNHHHHHQNYDDMMMMIGGCDDMMLPRGPSVSTPPPPPPSFSSGGLLEEGEGAGGCIAGDASTGRWPRQETLTLLDIRSRLHSYFKQPNQKGPLWEQVSRIMCEEHGYQRSGKKCKEKFENLYKYYKKTKESEGTQDNNNNNGKHYRFFHQLEALYGDENTNTIISSSSAPETNNFGDTNNLVFNKRSHVKNNHCDYYRDNSIINSSEFDDTSISCDHNNSCIRKRRKSNNWKVKIRELIDSEMRKVVEKQEEWLEKVVKIFEEKENERVLREENWRKEEEMRLENEHKFWARKREWIEARDSVLMDALKKLKEIRKDEKVINNNGNDDNVGVVGGTDFFWHGSDEITMIQQQGLCSEEEVANNRMACFGYERSSALLCKEKWKSVNKSYDDDDRDAMEGNIQKQKGKSSRSSFLWLENNGQ